MNSVKKTVLMQNSRCLSRSITQLVQHIVKNIEVSEFALYMNKHVECSQLLLLPCKTGGNIVSGFQELASRFLIVATENEVIRYKKDVGDDPADQTEVLVRLLK